MAGGKRVLLTGAQGFTGAHLVPLLQANGWDVWAIDRQFSGGSHAIPPDQCLQADLLDEASLTAAVQRIAPQAVIHLAAIAFVGHGSADDFYRVNVMGTRHLLQALGALPTPPQCVLLASSANIYGNNQEGALPESAPANPANDYAVSKLAGSWQQVGPLGLDPTAGPGEEQHGCAAGNFRKGIVPVGMRYRGVTARRRHHSRSRPRVRFTMACTSRSRPSMRVFTESKRVFTESKRAFISVRSPSIWPFISVRRPPISLRRIRTNKVDTTVTVLNISTVNDPIMVQICASFMNPTPSSSHRSGKPARAREAKI